MGNESDGIQFQPNSGNKNLSRILCPKTLPPIFRAATLASLKQLLKEMPDEFWERYETLEHRANHRRYKVGLRFFSEDQKTAAYEHLVRQRILTECGFAAAINTRANPSLSDADAVQYRRFQILVIVSCLQLYLIGGHECAIENALREMRLIATEASHMPVLGVLPNITPNQDLEALIETIRTHRTQSYTSPLIERGLGFIFVAIYDAYRFAKGIRRYRKSTKLPIQEHYVDLIEREKLDDTSVAIEELILCPTSSEEVILDETPIVDKHKTLRVYDPSSPHKSLFLNAELNKRFTEQLAMRELSLPCSFEQASDWDIEHLVRSIIDGTTQIGMWLLVNLVCGGIPNSTKSGRYLAVMNDWLCLELIHEVPSRKLDDRLHSLLPVTRSRIVLPLPSVLHGLDYHSRRPSDDELSELLKEINNRYQTRLTLGRVTRYLEHWVINQGVDPMLVALIRGHDFKKRPALAYSNIPAGKVIDVHRAYIEHLFKLAERTSGLPPLKSISTKVGSSVILPEKVLHNLFNQLLRPPPVPRHDAHLTDVINFHNQYVGYVWALLSFATGHRDVTAPMGSLADFNSTTRTWWISDKENRIGLTARTLIIPDTAVKQVELYLSHIQSINQRTRLLHNDLANRCNAVLDGSQNLLFFIRQDKQERLIPQDVTPKNLKEELGMRMPLQRNWARHHLRSMLLQSELPPSVIDGWMGHENIGEEMFGHHSGLSIHTLKQVADLIEIHLNHHQIEARSGWQTR